MKNDMGSTNMKRNLLRTFRRWRQQDDRHLDAHIKQWGRCLSECIEGNRLRNRVTMLDEVIKETLNA